MGTHHIHHLGLIRLYELPNELMMRRKMTKLAAMKGVGARIVTIVLREDDVI
jgi:hypothetical protein